MRLKRLDPRTGFCETIPSDIKTVWNAGCSIPGSFYEEIAMNFISTCQKDGAQTPHNHVQGMFPAAQLPGSSARILVIVEGANDVEFLKRISAILHVDNATRARRVGPTRAGLARLPVHLTHQSIVSVSVRTCSAKQIKIEQVGGFSTKSAGA